jgi:hypothetical protein
VPVDDPVPELVVSPLVELPIPDDEPELPDMPVLLEPPAVSDVLPEPLFFSGVVFEVSLLVLLLDCESLSLSLSEVVALDELRRGDLPVRPSGRAFFPSPTTPVPGSEPVSELVVPGSLADPVLPPVEPSAPVELVVPAEVPD